MLAFLQLGPGDGTLTAIGYLVINTVIGNLLEPRILGVGLGLSPLVVMLSLIFWGLLWGPVGTILSVPIVAVTKIVMERFETTAPVAALLAGRLDAITPRFVEE